MSAINLRGLISTAIMYYGTTTVVASFFPNLSTFALLALSAVLTPVAAMACVLIVAIVIIVGVLVASFFTKVNLIDSALLWFHNRFAPKQQVTGEL